MDYGEDVRLGCYHQFLRLLIISAPTKPIHAQGQHYKQQKKVGKTFKINTTNTRVIPMTYVVLVSLFLTLNIFHTFS